MRDRGKGSGLDRMRHAATELIGFPRTLAAAAVWSFQNGLQFSGSDATLVQPRVCLTSADFRVGVRMWSSSAGQDALPGTHHTDDLAGSLGLLCARGASFEETFGEDSPLATSMPATPASDRGAA